ncbi:MAG: hypothetical protein E5W26_13585 [Mesorhizobium sp.]|nr:MAG: hypothetical protein EOS27_20920 [Mesorhizobium sp.]TIU39543.1 MAG: hypothetical protein E5W26_13585 [Mesorhizobium sp.]
MPFNGRPITVRDKIRDRMINARVDREITLLLDRYVIGANVGARAIAHMALLDILVAASVQ